MKRIAILAALAAVCLTSCAARFGGSVGSVTMTPPAQANAAASCAVAPVLWAVPAGTPLMLHLRVTQGAWAWQDSLPSTYGGAPVAFTPPALPAITLATLTGWASDPDSAGCRLSITRTPATVAKPPAALTGLTVAP
jgi:hypothetical protein